MSIEQTRPGDSALKIPVVAKASNVSPDISWTLSVPWVSSPVAGSSPDGPNQVRGPGGNPLADECPQESSPGVVISKVTVPGVQLGCNSRE